LLRRAGGFAAAARAGWYARGFGGPGRADRLREDLGFDDEDDELWESVVDGVDMSSGAAGSDPESAIESLAMEVSGLAARGRMGAESSRQRFLEAARAFTQASAEEAQRQHHAQQAQQRIVAALTSPSELLRLATENTSEFQSIRWSNPSGLVTGHGQGSNPIEVETGSRHVAHLQDSANGEGWAIRSQTALPTRGDTFGGAVSLASYAAGAATSSTSTSVVYPPSANSGTGVPGDPPRRRAFGFRVAFDAPNVEAGGSMGGCYLVGLTTSSFTSYGEQNGLAQSPFFWGIEDSGRKYEGSRRGSSSSSRSRSRTSSSGPSPSPYATDIRPQDAPFNPADVLFGCQEVVTVVCDLESRTMAFWRDDTSLGTLVTSLPRGSSLYPVAVPFNRGSTVAITGLDGDPLPM